MKKIKFLKLFNFLLIISLFSGISITAGAESDETFKKAVKYFFQRKFEMAELLLRESLKKNPENHLAYSYLGDILLIKKQYDSALQFYRKALDIESQNAENYFRLGQIYYYKKMGPLAIENYQKSIALDPKITYAHYHIGLTYLMLFRDKENTIKSWETYLRLAPEDPQYEKIRRAIELLKDPNFHLPPLGSDISIEEALHLGGMILHSKDHEAKSQKADHESKKSQQKIEDIERDDSLQN
ncbi:MAG: tetratricopeptide repeat protein [Spirochaetes bacterium]|nr:tetratricopeptide repeat protein [Spirochaetota bacterium]